MLLREEEEEAGPSKGGEKPCYRCTEDDPETKGKNIRIRKTEKHARKHQSGSWVPRLLHVFLHYLLTRYRPNYPCPPKPASVAGQARVSPYIDTNSGELQRCMVTSHLFALIHRPGPQNRGGCSQARVADQQASDNMIHAILPPVFLANDVIGLVMCCWRFSGVEGRMAAGSYWLTTGRYQTAGKLSAHQPSAPFRGYPVPEIPR